MDKCFKCGISEEDTKLLKVISRGGIVKVCKQCFSKENLPLIKTQMDSPKEEIAQKVAPKIVQRQQLQIPREKENQTWLINNFHWIIMRARRLKHVSQKQVAQEIGESEKTIKDLEMGIVSKYNFQLINKIENNLGIKLMRIDNEMHPNPENELQRIHEEAKHKIPAFGKTSNEKLTISDLQRIRKEREAQQNAENIPSETDIEKEIEEWDLEEEKEESEKEKLTLKGIGKLIFGRK